MPYPIDTLMDYSYANADDLSAWNTVNPFSYPTDLGGGFDSGGSFDLAQMLAAPPPLDLSAMGVPSAGINPQLLMALIQSGQGARGGGGSGLFGGLFGGGGSPFGGFGGLNSTLQNTLGNGGDLGGPLAGGSTILQGILNDFLGSGPPGGSDIFGFSNNPIAGLFGGPGSTGGDIVGGGLTGAEIGSFFGPWGTAIGGALGLLGGGIESLFGGGRPHTQATQQSGNALAGNQDPITAFLGRDILQGAQGNRVLSESGSPFGTFEGQIAGLGDILEVLGNYNIPGLGGATGNQLSAAPSIGIERLGQGPLGGQLSPAAYEQKYGFAPPSTSELGAFLNSPFAPTPGNASGGFGPLLQTTLADYRNFLGAGGGGPGGAGANAAATALSGLGQGAGSGLVGGSLLNLGGTDITPLLQALNNANGANFGSNGLLQQIQQLIQQAVGNSGSGQKQQGKVYQFPTPQPDPWNLPMAA